MHAGQQRIHIDEEGGMMPSTAVSKGTKIYMYWYIDPLMLINVYGISVF